MSGGVFFRIARRDAVYRGAGWRELNRQRLGQCFHGGLGGGGRCEQPMGGKHMGDERGDRDDPAAG